MGWNKIHYKCQRKLKNQIKSIKINDKVESSPKILIDSLNNFFMTIAEKKNFFLNFLFDLQTIEKY